VRYNLKKKRSYKLTDIANIGSNGTTGDTEINFGGQTFTIGGLLEESTAVPVTYKFILRAV
jgi:hypothetical protein